MKSSLEIAQDATLQPIEAIAERTGLLPEEVEPYGRDKAKVSRDGKRRLCDQVERLDRGGTAEVQGSGRPEGLKATSRGRTRHDARGPAATASNARRAIISLVRARE